jgi:hypothetical protein
MAEEKKGPSLLLIIGILLFGGAIIQIVKTSLLSIIVSLKETVWSLTGAIKEGFIQGAAQLGIYTIFLVLVFLGIVLALKAIAKLF